jgi:DNA-binding PadR family transcriptional regulator
VLATLAIFILALIADGIDRAYQWQRRANLFTGASLPSVRRLLDHGLVREAETGPRGSRRFTLTRCGRRELENIPQYLQMALQKETLDAESILRLASLAHASGKRELASRLLNESALDRNRRMARRQKHLQYPLPKSVAEFYSQAIALYEDQRERAAVCTFDLLVSAVDQELQPKSPSRKRSGVRRS